MTIELHSNLLNSMASKLSSLLSKLTGQDTTLKDLQSACKTISSDEIDLSDVVTNIQNSSDSQSEQKKKLQKLKEKVENFIDKAEQVDTDVKDLINRRKDEFYKAHYNLKPYSEMGFWEKRWDNLKKVGQWCKEHWKLIVTIVLVVIAIAAIIAITVLTAGAALGPILTIVMGICKGLVIGAVVGGALGGASSWANGGSFWEGAENGAFSGALMGALFGGLGGVGQVLGSSCKLASSAGVLGKIIQIGDKVIPVVSKISGTISLAMAGFDLTSLGLQMYNKNREEPIFSAITNFNAQLHSSKLYNGFQIAVSALAVFSGGYNKGMNQRTCFVAGTMIHTVAGLVAIENIKAGDKVLSTNPETMETVHKSVLEAYIRKVDKLVYLTIAGALIITTIDHPFYVKNQDFIAAAELQVGYETVNSNGDVLLVEDIRIENTETTTVYNFQVEDFHTYHVSELGVLVHNANYQAGEYNYDYTTDEQGRITDVKAEDLKLTQRESRLPHKTNTPGKLPGDDAGHLIGDRFGGSPNLDNLTSQNSMVNRSGFKIIENEWAKAIKGGKDVSVDIKVNYSGESVRPSSYEVTYSIDGNITSKILQNK